MDGLAHESHLEDQEACQGIRETIIITLELDKETQTVSAKKEGRKRNMLSYWLLAGGGVVLIVAIVVLVLTAL